MFQKKQIKFDSELKYNVHEFVKKKIYIDFYKV